MFACLKNLQYFEKIQWKRLDTYVLGELGVTQKGSASEDL